MSITYFVIFYFATVSAELNIYLVQDQNDFKFLTPDFPNPSDVDFPEETFVFTSEKGNAVQIGCNHWETTHSMNDCEIVDMMIKDLKNGKEKRFCGDDICNKVSYISEGHELQVSFRCSKGNAISWYAKSVKASTTTEKPTTTTKKPTTTPQKPLTTTKKPTTTTTKPTTTTKKPTTTTKNPTTTTKKPTTTTTKPTTTKTPTTTTKKPTTTTTKPTTTTKKPTTTTTTKPTTTTKKPTTTTTKPTTTKNPTTTTKKPTTTTTKPTTTTMNPTTTTKKPTTTTESPTTTTMRSTTTTNKPKTSTMKPTTKTPPKDDENDPFREVIWPLVPGKSKVVTNPGYTKPVRGEGDIRYTFIGKKGYEILASCEDDFRPSVNYINPCKPITLTFDDGAYRKQFCSFYKLTETVFISNKYKINFQLNYTQEGSASIVRCVFRTTEPLTEPTKTIQVPKNTAINSTKRGSFSEDLYLIQGQNGKSFNLDCQFTDIESSYCILSRVIMKVDDIEMFCLNRDYRRKNITKAELRVYSDGNGGPEINCKFSLGSTSISNTPRSPPYGKKPRRDSIPRKEETKNWTLGAGETKEFVAERDAQNVLILNVKVAEGFKIYVFCDEYKPYYDGSLPCDSFAMIMEERGLVRDSWCSKRHLDSLGFLSHGPNLKLTVENFAKGNRVTCAVRSTEPPSPEVEITLTKNRPIFKIMLTKQQYMIKRWIISHPGKGKLIVKCRNDLLRAIYKNSDGQDTKKLQYFCFERRIVVNRNHECEEYEPSRPFLVETFEKVDVLIMKGKEGLNGHACSIEGAF